MISNTYILQPNTTLHLIVYNMDMTQHTFVTRFKEPVSVQSAIHYCIMAVVEREIMLPNTEYAGQVAQQIHNVLVEMFHKQQEKNGPYPPEDGPDLLHD